jgi:hypothetical protein
MNKLIILLLAFSSVAHADDEAKIKQAQQQCQYKAMIASTTQQTRQDYKAEFNEYQSWESFLHYVAEELNLKHDDGLKNALEISKHVFFDYSTETEPGDVLGAEFDKCWNKFLNENGEAI